MKTIIFLISVLSVTACMSEDEKLENAQATIREKCGLAPLPPGFAVAYEEVNGYRRVLMTPEGWTAIQNWWFETSFWEACAQGFVRDVDRVSPEEAKRFITFIKPGEKVE